MKGNSIASWVDAEQTDGHTYPQTDGRTTWVQSIAFNHRLALFHSSVCTNHRLEIQYCITSKCYRGVDNLRNTVFLRGFLCNNSGPVDVRDVINRYCYRENRTNVINRSVVTAWCSADHFLLFAVGVQPDPPTPTPTPPRSDARLRLWWIRENTAGKKNIATKVLCC